MAFLESDLGTFIFNVLLTIVMMIITKKLWESALASLKSSGGKLWSTFDEIIIFAICLGICIVCWNMGIVKIVETAIVWVRWAWDKIVPVLRNLGFPVQVIVNEIK